MILSRENPKETTKKLLEIRNEYSKVAGYMLNVQKQIVFLYPSNKQSKSKIKKTIPFTIKSKRKCSEII